MIEKIFGEFIIQVEYISTIGGINNDIHVRFKILLEEGSKIENKFIII